MEFVPTEPEFPPYVESSWQGTFNVEGNDYLLLMDICPISEDILGALCPVWPFAADEKQFCMVKFDNVVNRVRGKDYEATPKGDPNRPRLSHEGLSALSSHILGAIEVLAVQQGLRIFTASADRDVLGRYYGYMLTVLTIPGYVSHKFDFLNGQAYFALARRP